MSNDTDEGGLPGGLPGGLGGLLEKAKELQQRLHSMQDELGRRTAVGEAGGGMVRVTANGRNEIMRVEIEPDVIDREEREMLQDLVVAAANQALQAAQRMVAEEMTRATGGLNIPGLF